MIATFKNNQGFGIIESVVGMSIGLAGVMLGSAMLNGLARGSKNIEAKNEFSSFVQNVQGLTNERGQCKLSFWNHSSPVKNAVYAPDAAPSTIPTEDFLYLIQSESVAIAEVGQKFNNFTIESMSIQEDDVAARKITATEIEYRVHLNITASKKLHLGNPTVSHSFPIYLKTQRSDNRIIGCSPSSGADRALASGTQSCPAGQYASGINFDTGQLTCNPLFTNRLLGSRSIYVKSSSSVTATSEVLCDGGTATCAHHRVTLKVPLPAGTQNAKIRFYGNNLTSYSTSDVTEDHATGEFILDFSKQSSTGYFGVTGGSSSSYVTLMNWNDRPFSATSYSSDPTKPNYISGDRDGESTYGTDQAAQLYLHVEVHDGHLFISGLQPYTNNIQETWLFEFNG